MEQNKIFPALVHFLFQIFLTLARFLPQTSSLFSFIVVKKFKKAIFA